MKTNPTLNPKTNDSVPNDGPTSPLTPDQVALAAALAADGLAIQHQFRPEPLLKLTGRGFYESDTVAEIARFKKRWKDEKAAASYAHESGGARTPREGNAPS